MPTFTLPSNFLSPEAVLVLALIDLAILIGLLGSLLSQRDLDPIVRLTWVAILIFVPIGGIVLYFLLPTDPRTAPKKTKRTEGGAPDASANQLRGTPWENDPGHTNG